MIACIRNIFGPEWMRKKTRKLLKSEILSLVLHYWRNGAAAMDHNRLPQRVPSGWRVRWEYTMFLSSSGKRVHRGIRRNSWCRHWIGEVKARYAALLHVFFTGQHLAVLHRPHDYQLIIPSLFAVLYHDINFCSASSFKLK